MPETLHSTVLIDSEKNVNMGNWSLKGSDVAGAGEGWSIHNKMLHGGKQEGSQLLTVDTGAMQLSLIPTRGMGIYQVKAGDVQLGWQSPIKEIVHPSFMNLESRNGLGWLEGFNEWLCRCGLEFSGHPGVDEFIDNVGAKNTMVLTLHGKIANTPCCYAEVLVEKDVDTVRIIIRSKVEERVFHGPKLELWSDIVIEADQTRFRIQDTVHNRGSQPQEMQMMYHCNFGAPLLEEGAKFVAPIKTNEPFNNRAAEGLDHFDTYEAPISGFIEQVYKITLRSRADGQTGVLLHSKDATRGASMRFSTEELPYFTQWKYTNAKEDGYVTGLEPGTSFPHNRKVERKEGRVQALPPHSKKAFHLEIELLNGLQRVQAVKSEIESI